ncbi:MAG TPA: hypothetical protein PK402_04835 [Tepidisphaeraceae bacterium]|nr:hypothetical protein [Tepidisphaeraceae bacterium]
MSVEMAQQFEVVQVELELAYRKAVEPETRTKPSVTGKNSARDAMKQAARPIVSIINGQTNLTDAQRIELGLTVPRQRSRISAPDVAPMIEVTEVSGHIVRLRLRDTVVARRGRPEGVAGANVYCFAGEIPPKGLTQWTFFGNSSSRDFEITLDESIPPGTKVWLTACWYNPRGMNGPACDPVNTVVQFGGIINKLAYRYKEAA